MHHQGREYNIERLVREGETLDHADLELDGRMALGRFRAGAGDLLRAGVNANDAARRADAPLGFKR